MCGDVSERRNTLGGEVEEMLVERNLAYVLVFHLVRFLMWVCGGEKVACEFFFPLMSPKSN